MHEGDRETGLMPEPRAYGIILIVGSLLAFGGMSLHPSGGGAPLEMVRRIIQSGSFNAAVHGFLMAVYLLLVLGFFGFSRWLGGNRPLVQAGFIAYVAGAFAGIAAAISAGFVMRSIALGYTDAGPGQEDLVRNAFRVAGAFNYAWGRMWMLAISIAVLLWSIALLRRESPARLVALFGIAVGGVGTIGFVTGLISLSIMAVLGVIAGHTLWSVAAGWLLVRRD